MNALIVCSNTSVFPGKGSPTGFWFGELVQIYDVLKGRRLKLDLASPNGGAIHADPRSMDSKDDLIKQYAQNNDFLKKLNNTLSLSEIDPSEYSIINLVGGHGAVWDFSECEILHEVIRTIYHNKGMITAVGYGVSGLLNLKLKDGSWFVKERYLTGFSNIEERLVSFFTEVPFFLEDKLVERGAHYTKTVIPFTEHIELDERLITGQNPNSARKVALKLLEEILEK